MSVLSKEMRGLLNELEGNYAVNGVMPKIVYSMTVEAENHIGCIIEVNRTWLENEATALLLRAAENALADLRRRLHRNGWDDHDDNSPRNFFYDCRVRYRFMCPKEIKDSYRKI